MKGFKEAYRTIFHSYNEHGSHKKSFYISNMHWVFFIPNQLFMNILHVHKLVQLSHSSEKFFHFFFVLLQELAKLLSVQWFKCNMRKMRNFRHVYPADVAYRMIISAYMSLCWCKTCPFIFCFHSLTGSQQAFC